MGIQSIWSWKSLQGRECTKSLVIDIRQCTAIHPVMVRRGCSSFKPRYPGTYTRGSVRRASGFVLTGYSESTNSGILASGLPTLVYVFVKGKHNPPDARFGGARTTSIGQHPQLARVPLGDGSCLRRTGHPFTVSDPCGPSQKIECVFSASPETIRREPREFDVRRSVGNRRTWQSARCVISLFFARRAEASTPLRSGNLRRVRSRAASDPRRADTLFHPRKARNNTSGL
jgi:hypothetical protein